MEKVSREGALTICFWKKIFRWGGIGFFVLFLLGGARVVKAATLYLSPASGNYAIGKTFTVNVYVSSAEEAMNAASGVLDFPMDKLEVTGVSKSGSVLSLWVQEPSFSNTIGSVSFEGIVFNPGFIGNGGKIISISFKGKVAGSAPITFTSGSILANDGQGRSILTGMGGATFTIGGGAPETTAAPKTEKTEKTETQPAEKPSDATPSAPKISSVTHPASDEWYNNNNPKFSWIVGKGVTDVSVALDRQATTDPGTRSDGLFNSKVYPNIEDGVWYFHLRLKNSVGWGAATHYRIKVDTVAPEAFSVRLVADTVGGPQPSITWEARDALSGMSNRCEWQVDNSGFVAENDCDNLTLPPQAPGQHALTVRLFDLAGNSASAGTEFNVKMLEVPVITDYSRAVVVGDKINISGTTAYVDGQLNVWWKAAGGAATSLPVQATDKNFVAAIETKQVGNYEVWVEAVNTQGARSAPSEHVISKAVSAGEGINWLYFLGIFVPLSLCFTALLFGIFWYVQSRRNCNSLWRGRSFGVRQTEGAWRRAASLLAHDAAHHVRALQAVRKKRLLTAVEREILARAEKGLKSLHKHLQ